MILPSGIKSVNIQFQITICHGRSLDLAAGELCCALFSYCELLQPAIKRNDKLAWAMFPL